MIVNSKEGREIVKERTEKAHKLFLEQCVHFLTWTETEPNPDNATYPGNLTELTPMMNKEGPVFSLLLTSVLVLLPCHHHSVTALLLMPVPLVIYTSNFIRLFSFHHWLKLTLFIMLFDYSSLVWFLTFKLMSLLTILT